MDKKSLEEIYREKIRILLSACVSVSGAHAHIETCDMPGWLEEVEEAIKEASKPIPQVKPRA